MRDVLDQLEAWWAAGADVAIGTVIRTWNSAPRLPGAVMLIGPDGTVAGSVSGGCVESAVYELGTSVRNGAAPVLQRYGVSDDRALSVGLTCGGTIEVFVERVNRSNFPDLAEVVDDIRAGRPVAVATIVDADDDLRGHRLVIRTDSTSGSLGSRRRDEAVTDDARGFLEQGRSAMIRYGHDGERRIDDIGVFVSCYAPRPRMIVFGAIDFAAAVARIGSFLGFRVTVCDARPVFATAERFPHADDVVVEWPHKYLARTRVDERTVICVLTHDPKFDVPLLEVALRLPVAYVGAMGSRRTDEDRAARLLARGVTESELQRLRAPIGLDIGARTPEETAVSVAAEIISMRWGGSGVPLRSTAGPIHRPHQIDAEPADDRAL